MKPPFQFVPLAEGRRWRGGGGFRYEEKIDGQFALAEFRTPNSALRILPPGEAMTLVESNHRAANLQSADSILAGEWLPRAAQFYAFDILQHAGEDVRPWPLSERLRLLNTLVPESAANLQSADCLSEDTNYRLQVGSTLNSSLRIPHSTLSVLRPATGHGGEFLEAVLERGGEGVVAKELNAPYGARWFKCKRAQVFYCRITAKDHWTGGVTLADRDTGEARGQMPLRGDKFERVTVGEIIKVEAYGLTAKGRLREARPDPQGWRCSEKK